MQIIYSMGGGVLLGWEIMAWGKVNKGEGKKRKLHRKLSKMLYILETLKRYKG